MKNMDITEQILRLNYAGLPIEWINYQTAVRLYCSDQVTYECGDSSLELGVASAELPVNRVRSR